MSFLVQKGSWKEGGEKCCDSILESRNRTEKHEMLCQKILIKLCVCSVEKHWWVFTVNWFWSSRDSDKLTLRIILDSRLVSILHNRFPPGHPFSHILNFTSNLRHSILITRSRFTCFVHSHTPSLYVRVRGRDIASYYESREKWLS